MTLDQFITQYTGVAVDVDGVPADTGQCVQLVCLYLEEVLNLPYPPHDNAAIWWTDPALEQYFDKIEVGQPVQTGDVVVFSASLPGSNGYGHIDICIDPIDGGYWGFDSNWGTTVDSNGYPAAHEVQHNFIYVLGYLRVKGESMDTADLEFVRTVCVGMTDLQPETNQNFMNNVGLDKTTVVNNFLNYTEARNLRLDAEAYRKGDTSPLNVTINNVSYVPKP